MKQHPFIPSRPSFALALLLILTASLLCTGCQHLDGYRRTYSLSYTTSQGQPVGVGITLDPVSVRRSGK